jgi:hypothetical protein
MNTDTLEKFLRAQNVPEEDIILTVARELAEKQTDRLSPGSWDNFAFYDLNWRPDDGVSE